MNTVVFLFNVDITKQPKAQRLLKCKTAFKLANKELQSTRQRELNKKTSNGMKLHTDIEFSVI
jgi:hypothetical protein